MPRAFRYGNDQDRAEAATLNHINVVQELAPRLAEGAGSGWRWRLLRVI
jgi:hypothetical protein